jgi:hypothetical protein
MPVHLDPCTSISDPCISFGARRLSEGFGWYEAGRRTRGSSGVAYFPRRSPTARSRPIVRGLSGCRSVAAIINIIRRERSRERAIGTVACCILRAGTVAPCVLLFGSLHRCIVGSLRGLADILLRAGTAWPQCAGGDSDSRRRGVAIGLVGVACVCVCARSS